jgi:hexosaminidase
VTIEPNGGGFEESMTIRLSSDVPGVMMYYTLDGTRPSLGSARYTSPIYLTRPATVIAVAAVDGEICIEATEARFTRCKSVKGITLEKQNSPKYPGHGATTVIDGFRGPADFQDSAWLGFEGDDVTATLDLGRTQRVDTVTAGYLQQQGSWIFLPSNVTVSTSVDGKRWTRPVEVASPVARSEEVLAKDFVCPLGNTSARYIRVAARNIGVCPPWHSGAGDKAWLFVDEIIVR